MSNNRNHGSRPVGDSPNKELPEKLKLSQAHKFLGISFAKMTSLVTSGILPFEEDPLDRRVKLVKRSDLEALRRQQGTYA